MNILQRLTGVLVALAAAAASLTVVTPAASASTGLTITAVSHTYVDVTVENKNVRYTFVWGGATITDKHIATLSGSLRGPGGATVPVTAAPGSASFDVTVTIPVGSAHGDWTGHFTGFTQAGRALTVTSEPLEVINGGLKLIVSDLRMDPPASLGMSTAVWGVTRGRKLSSPTADPDRDAVTVEPAGSPYRLRYQWQTASAQSPAGPFTDIPGATSATFTPGIEFASTAIRIEIWAESTSGTRSRSRSLFTATGIVGEISVPTADVLRPTADLSAGTFTVPQQTEVKWQRRVGSSSVWNDIEPGVHDAGGTQVVLRAVAKQGYTIWNVPNAEFDFRRQVSAARPFANLSLYLLEIPESADVTYRRSGTTQDLAPGFHPMQGSVSIQAVLKDPERTRFTGASSFSFSFPVEMVTPAAVTFDQRAGTFTVPDTEGVSYRRGGDSVAPGTHRSRENVVITATSAHPMYVLQGTTQWQFDLRTVLAAGQPFFYPDDLRVTIPTQDRDALRWKINGAEVEPGAHTVEGNVELTVEVRDPATQRLEGTSSWSFDANLVERTAAPVVLRMVPGTYEIPADMWAAYEVDGEVVPPGVYSHPSRTVFTVTAVSKAKRYRLVGQTVFTVDLRYWIEADEPTFDPERRSVTIPVTEGVVYSLDGVEVQSGEHLLDSAVEVTADVTDPSFTRIWGTPSWSFDGSAVTVRPPAPRWDAAAGTYVIPAVTGVEYLVNGAVVAAGEYSARAEVTVEARPAVRRYQVAGTAEWTFDLRTPVAPAIPVIDPSAGTVTVPTMPPGVVVQIGGTTVAPGVHVVSPGTTITVVATDSGVVVDLPESTWTMLARPTSPGSSTPGSGTPGSSTPGSSTPGSSTPGSSTPESSTPGTSTPGTSTQVAKKKVKVAAPRFTRRTGRLVLATTRGVTYKVTVVTPKSGAKKAKKKVRTLKPGARLVLKKRQRVTVRAVAASNRTLSGKSLWRFRR